MVFEAELDVDSHIPVLYVSSLHTAPSTGASAEIHIWSLQCYKLERNNDISNKDGLTVLP